MHAKRFMAGLAVGVALMGLLIGLHARLVWNISPSLPIGLYWRQAVGEIRIGDLVEFTPPDAIIQKFPTGWRGTLIKQVVGLAGDRACWTAAAFIVMHDQQRMVVALEAAHTAPDESCEIVSAVSFLGVGQHQRSLDSRYVGQIDRRRIVHKVVPLWTWGEE